MSTERRADSRERRGDWQSEELICMIPRSHDRGYKNTKLLPVGEAPDFHASSEPMFQSLYRRVGLAEVSFIHEVFQLIEG